MTANKRRNIATVAKSVRTTTKRPTRDDGAVNEGGKKKTRREAKYDSEEKKGEVKDKARIMKGKNVDTVKDEIMVGNEKESAKIWNETYYDLKLDINPSFEIVESPFEELEKHTSMKLIPPFWLAAKIQGHKIHFALDSGSTHNVVDVHTAERIGLFEYTPTEHIYLYGWQNCEDVVKYAVYTDIQVYLDMSRVTVTDIKEEDLEDLYFYTDIWVPPPHVKTPCTLGIGTMTRLGMVQRFDLKEPTVYFMNAMLIMFQPMELDFKPLSVVKARCPGFIPKYLNTMLHSFNLISKSLNILISTGTEAKMYISKFCLKKLNK
ncbi:hypothetical protein Pcinc_024928 [Petrolisthes cinctipes]|uniref:Uncharacterized protein n=1 Tax=Petrolisthes cinctipes TaxID=88211 RepID=A0AAE1F9S3_PETCI|nr:hypothetical protein Pcinc_024928 [Petrolisthes cinctipes]